MLPGEGVTDGEIESSDSRVAEMCLGGHLCQGLPLSNPCLTRVYKRFVNICLIPAHS